jgi:hypothetical protein
MQSISDKSRSYIKVSFEFEGIHNYVNAPIEVSFLRLPHRHLFKCSAKIEVFHEDREIEFILAKRYLKSQCEYDLSGKSCEQICKYFIEAIILKYGDRSIVVEVSEDGENSAIVEYR